MTQPKRKRLRRETIDLSKYKVVFVGELTPAQVFDLHQACVAVTAQHKEELARAAKLKEQEQAA